VCAFAPSKLRQLVGEARKKMHETTHHGSNQVVNLRPLRMRSPDMSMKLNCIDMSWRGKQGKPAA